MSRTRVTTQTSAAATTASNAFAAGPLVGDPAATSRESSENASMTCNEMRVTNNTARERYLPAARRSQFYGLALSSANWVSDPLAV